MVVQRPSGVKPVTAGVELSGPRLAAGPASGSEPDLTRATPRSQGVTPVAASDRSGDQPSAPAARRYHDAAVRPACPPASADRTPADKAPATPAAGPIAPDRGAPGRHHPERRPGLGDARRSNHPASRPGIGGTGGVTVVNHFHGLVVRDESDIDYIANRVRGSLDGVR